MYNKKKQLIINKHVSEQSVANYFFDRVVERVEAVGLEARLGRI